MPSNMGPQRAASNHVHEQLVFVRARVKKDIPMLTISFLLYITLERSVGVIC
jgi:hypothetical protein